MRESKKIILEEEAANVINCLALVLKTAQIHDINNIAVVKAIHKLIELLNILLSEGRITLQLMGDHFYVNENRVRHVVEYMSNFDFIFEEFKKIGIGSIIFEDSLEERDIKVLVSGVLKASNSETPFETLIDEMELVDTMTVREPLEIKDDISEFEKKRLIKKSYSNAVSIMKGVTDTIKTNERINLARSKRVIGSIVDHIVEQECQSTLFGMTTIKDYDEYTYFHSVNVSILSMALGNKIGLPRKALADLGLAALFHDLGKVDIPLDVLNKPSKLSDEDWTVMRQHPWLGTAKILQFKGVNASSINIAISAFEHHINNDLSGYPHVASAFDLELFSKIISIADRYDAITSSRIYSRTPRTPTEALSMMYNQNKNELDTPLLKMFIQMIGVYPTGCLVVLDTNELGLVLDNNRDPEFIDRPLVLLIADSTGNKIESTEVDLTEKDESGSFVRSVARTLVSAQYGIDLSEYLS
jgi:HD-GYP domain-containing protein (c-di-GMP phosphodiesterase class II)